MMGFKVMHNNLFIAMMLVYSGLATAEEGSLSMTTGIDYSSGKYGQAEKTNITYVPLTAKYEVDRWSFKGTLAWLTIDGPGGVTGDGTVVDNGTDERAIESGFGDIVASATYSALQLEQQKFYVDVGAKVKLPTASERKGLGTGKTDYAVSVDLYKTFDRFTLLGTLGYKVFGDPAGVDLNNVWFGTVGGVYKLDQKNSAGLTVDMREATTESSTKLLEYTLFYSYKFNDTYKLQTYLSAGDTRSSADFGGGAMLGISW